MRVRYKGIALTMTGSDVPLSASDLWTWDAVITCAQTTAIKDADGVTMVTLPANTPFYLPTLGHQQWGDEPQLNLGQYSANAGAGTVWVAYSVRV